MTNLERYLNNATRGIWGKRKLEIREELESDITERARKYEISGLEQQNAILQAIAELGSARAFSNGMKGVYVMPNLIRSSILATAIFAGTIAVLSSSNAQISVSPIKGADVGVVGLYLEVNSLVADLKKAGLVVMNSQRGLEIKLNGLRAFIPWTKYNSRVFQGRKEIISDNVFGALQNAGIQIQQVNNTEKLEYQINGKSIVFDTDSEVSQSWNLNWATTWAVTYLISHVKPNYEGAIWQTGKKPVANSTLEGTQAQLAGKIITLTTFQKDSANFQGKSYLKVFTSVTKADENGHFQLELPKGTYKIATPQDTGFKVTKKELEITQPEQGVLMLGVRKSEWIISRPQSFSFLNTTLKTINLEAGKTVQLP